MVSRPGWATFFYIKLNDKSRTKEIIEKIKQKYRTEDGEPKYDVIDADEWFSMMQASNASVLGIVFNGIVFLGVCIGVLVIFLTMYTTVSERTARSESSVRWRFKGIHRPADYPGVSLSLLRWSHCRRWCQLSADVPAQGNMADAQHSDYSGLDDPGCCLCSHQRRHRLPVPGLQGSLARPHRGFGLRISDVI
jgi:hypothetical protein